MLRGKNNKSMKFFLTDSQHDKKKIKKNALFFQKR